MVVGCLVEVQVMFDVAVNWQCKTVLLTWPNFFRREANLSVQNADLLSVETGFKMSLVMPFFENEHDTCSGISI